MQSIFSRFISFFSKKICGKTKCPYCKSRKTVLDKSIEIDPKKLPNRLPYSQKNDGGFPDFLCQDTKNCYQKIPGGNVFKMYREKYSCKRCYNEFKIRREVLIARAH